MKSKPDTTQMLIEDMTDFATEWPDEATLPDINMHHRPTGQFDLYDLILQAPEDQRAQLQGFFNAEVA